jgi:hypothetical protein
MEATLKFPATPDAKRFIPAGEGSFVIAFKEPVTR